MISYKISGGDIVTRTIEDEVADLRKQVAELVEKNTIAPTITVYYKDRTLPKIQRSNDLDGYYNLFNGAELNLRTGETGFINLSLQLDVPKGYEVHIMPTSNLHKKGILFVNCYEIIKVGKSDIISIPVHCIGSTHIKFGERIARMEIVKIKEQINIQEIVDLT